MDKPNHKPVKSVDMKKSLLFVIALVFLCAYNVEAQHPSVTFVGGLNVAEMPVTHGNTSTAIEDSYKPLFGFHIGANYDYVLKKKRNNEFTVEAGLLFESKGYKQDLDQEGLSLKNTTTLYYVDIPIYIKYRYRFRNRNKAYIGVGPYVGAGLFGNSNIEFAYGDGEASNNSEKIKWGSDEMEDDLKRLDYGVSGKVGYLFDGGLNLSLSYDYGLPNVAAQSDITEYKHRLLRVSVGYTIKLED